MTGITFTFKTEKTTIGGNEYELREPSAVLRQAWLTRLINLNKSIADDDSDGAAIPQVNIIESELSALAACTLHYYEHATVMKDGQIDYTETLEKVISEMRSNIRQMSEIADAADKSWELCGMGKSTMVKMIQELGEIEQDGLADISPDD